MPQDVMGALAKALQPYMGNPEFKAATGPFGTPSTPYMWGPGGLFGVAGLSRDVISTRVIPAGLASMIPAQGSVDMNPFFPYITGFLTATGTDPVGVCDDGKVAGSIKNCIQTAQFGMYTRMTRELEVTHVGQKTNRGEFKDLTLVNDPLAAELGAVLAPASSKQSQNWLGSEMLERYVEVGISFQLLLGRQFFTGNPANGNNGGYLEFPGLDILISENKYDAKSGAACPTLNSLIRDFNYGNVAASSLNPDIVDTLTWMYRDRKSLADRMNFGDCQWTFAMRRELFWEITAVWPCSYLTYRCQFRAADNTMHLNVSANDQIAMRDNMRSGKFLLIDGENVPVVLDDNIVEHNRSAAPTKIAVGGYSSDIYLVSLTAQGGRFKCLFWEYFDYSSPLGTYDAIVDGKVASYYWTDGGMYIWHAKPPKNWCIQHIAKIQPRLVLNTPHLAARLMNVQYVPLIHGRDAQPDNYYFVNGGQQTPRQQQIIYSDWNLPV